MDTELSDGLQPSGEANAVATWRLDVLLEAGYEPALAELVAASDADLHLAVSLVDQGCPPRLAAEIVL
jgi:hypothetical protein